jgi:hypothetical protein
MKDDDKKQNETRFSISIGGNVGRDVNISEGDIIHGDKIDVGPVTDSTGIAIGRDSQVTIENQPAITTNVFAQARSAIDDLDLPAVEQADARHAVDQLERQAGEEQPHQDRVDRYLDILAEIAPQVIEVIINAIANPGALIGSGFKLAVETWRAARRFRPQQTV